MSIPITTKLSYKRVHNEWGEKCKGRKIFDHAITGSSINQRFMFLIKVEGNSVYHWSSSKLHSSRKRCSRGGETERKRKEREREALFLLLSPGPTPTLLHPINGPTAITEREERNDRQNCFFYYFLLPLCDACPIAMTGLHHDACGLLKTKHSLIE